MSVNQTHSSVLLLMFLLLSESIVILLPNPFKPKYICMWSWFSEECRMKVAWSSMYVCFLIFSHFVFFVCFSACCSSLFIFFFLFFPRFPPLRSHCPHSFTFSSSYLFCPPYPYPHTSFLGLLLHVFYSFRLLFLFFSCSLPNSPLSWPAYLCAQNLKGRLRY